MHLTNETTQAQLGNVFYEILVLGQPNEICN